ncbi:monooxygenase family protein [Domibacillus sp. PGB-M46]|uniref:monooxygenase family protein n=1 Tax=Domibacillus sp. PGB-M46 TaxID=2910255 RepID=UPI0035C9308F
MMLTKKTKPADILSISGFCCKEMDDLLAYSKNERHLTAWANFNKKVGNNPAVGIIMKPTK